MGGHRPVAGQTARRMATEQLRPRPMARVVPAAAWTAVLREGPHRRTLQRRAASSAAHRRLASAERETDQRPMTSQEASPGAVSADAQPAHLLALPEVV